MKKLRILSALLVLALVLPIASSCDQFSALSDILSSARTDSVLTGNDYITYRNSKRGEAIADYVGKKVDSNKSELLLDNIELTYYKLEDDVLNYEIYIENANKSYYFNGVVTLKGATQEIKINVRMLAPEWYEYFTFAVSGNPDDYEYFVEGDLYEVKKESEIAYEYWFDAEGLSNYESMVIVDVPVITEKIANEFAKFFYDEDAIYNYDDDITYYLLSEEEYEAGQTKGIYTLVTNTEEQEVILKIDDPDKQPEEKTLTFSK